MPSRNKVIQLDPRRVQPTVMGNYVIAHLRQAFPPPDHKVITEHRFTDERKWRFDVAVLPERVAVEFQGGTHTLGRHTRGVGYRLDSEKFLHAATLGWTVILLPYDLLRDDLDLVLSSLELAVLVRCAPESRRAIRR